MEKLNAVIDALDAIEQFDGLLSVEHGVYKAQKKEIHLTIDVFEKLFGGETCCLYDNPNVYKEEHMEKYVCFYIVIKGIKIFALGKNT